jgi:hypothetical protein
VWLLPPCSRCPWSSRDRNHTNCCSCCWEKKLRYPCSYGYPVILAVVVVVVVKPIQKSCSSCLVLEKLNDQSERERMASCSWLDEVSKSTWMKTDSNDVMTMTRIAHAICYEVKARVHERSKVNTIQDSSRHHLLVKSLGYSLLQKDYWILKWPVTPVSKEKVVEVVVTAVEVA